MKNPGCEDQNRYCACLDSLTKSQGVNGTSARGGRDCAAGRFRGDPFESPEMNPKPEPYLKIPYNSTLMFPHILQRLTTTPSHTPLFHQIPPARARPMLGTTLAQESRTMTLLYPRNITIIVLRDDPGRIKRPLHISCNAGGVLEHEQAYVI